MQINCESRRGLKVRWQFRYPLWVNSRLQALIKLCPPYFLKADIATSPRHVCFVPLATERSAAKNILAESVERDVSLLDNGLPFFCFGREQSG
jgi:hypothetical protein